MTSIDFQPGSTASGSLGGRSGRGGPGGGSRPPNRGGQGGGRGHYRDRVSNPLTF
jgi:hypothetical protein